MSARYTCLKGATSQDVVHTFSDLPSHLLKAYSARENGLFRNMMNLRKVTVLMSNDMKISIQGRFPLSGVQEAVDTYLRNMSAGKVLLIMGRR